MRKGRIYIGTSNIVVPGNKNSYPPQYQGKSRLQYYTSFFNSLEINSSFYKTPMPATFKKWALNVGTDFTFSVKLSKEVTHEKTLLYKPEKIKLFLHAASELGLRRGCLLIQFPGKIGLAFYKELESILSLIDKEGFADPWRIAIEFRNPDWYVSETLELLDEYNASIVQHDMARCENAVINRNAAFVYKRFHGPAGNYRGSYADSVLIKWAKACKSFSNKGKDVYIYFNNTMGNAFQDALSLKKLLIDSN